MPKTVIPADLPRKKVRKTQTLSEPTVFKPTPSMRKKLETLRQHFLRRASPKKKSEVAPDRSVKRAYQPVAERELKRIVFLRYGNLEGSGVAIRSFNEIASLMRKWPMTVHSALKRWEQNGRTAVDGRTRNGLHMKKKAALQGPLKDYLLSKETLDAWSGHCLTNRCILLEKAKNVKVSWQVLRNFYLKNGVKYLASNYAYQQSLQQQKSVILDFAIELAQLVFDDKVVIYFDESSFNMWLRGRKTWQHPDEPVKLLINKARGTSVTLYGAIGSDMHKPFFMSAPATRQDYVVKFLTQLRKFVRHSPQTTLHLVIDNHPAHKTKLVEEACQRLNIQRHFMPGYSPEFNSIEALWGWIKRDVKKRLVFRKFEELTQPQFTQLLSESLGAITYEQQANAARYNNREFLHRTLGECIRREDYPHLFLDKAPAQDDDDSLFAADPLLLDDIQLLDRLDLEVQSQLSIGDMLNLQPSHGRTPSQASDIPHAEIRSDAQPLAFKAVRRYVQSKLDWWND